MATQTHNLSYEPTGKWHWLLDAESAAIEEIIIQIYTGSIEIFVNDNPPNEEDHGLFISSTTRNESIVFGGLTTEHIWLKPLPDNPGVKKTKIVYVTR